MYYKFGKFEVIEIQCAKYIQPHTAKDKPKLMNSSNTLIRLKIIDLKKKFPVSSEPDIIRA